MRPRAATAPFDEYRADTLRRLEEEQREFRDFLDRLRFAKDKTEFDQFMAERRNRPDAWLSAAPELMSRFVWNKAAPAGRPLRLRRFTKVTTP